MREGYAVTVTKWGEPILTIESQCLSGAELSDDDERAVFEAGQHLCSFAGDPDTASDDECRPNYREYMPSDAEWMEEEERMADTDKEAGE